MADEDKPAAPADAEPAGTQTETPEVKTFTQEQVDQFVIKAKSKGERKGRRDADAAQTESKPEQTQQPQADVARIEKLEARVIESEKQSKYADALSRIDGAANLTEIQRKVLYTQFDAEHPEDLAATCKAIYGLMSKQVANVDEQQTNDDPQYESPGAPSAAPGEASTDPRQWSLDDYNSLRSQFDGNGRRLSLNLLDKWADSLPGGGGGLFRKKIPGG